ncbi:MAG TPA: TIR domain-containing protein [Candidatus Limnocylindrales bacterium]|nr:TIR domain-containing protein [Candidatus Limnocylindrales bacterium]
MARVFVSHSGADISEAAELHRLLAALGHEVFLDVDRQDGIRVGEDWKQRLYEQLRRADAVVCLISDASVQSQWCTIEIAVAQMLGTRILPLSAQRGVRHPLLADMQHGDFENDRHGSITMVDAALRSVAAREGWPDGRNPFPGLRAFDPDWQRVFFGRDRELRDLASAVRSLAERRSGEILAVVGPSGCGKSSLVRAGLIPAMAGEPGWWVLPPMVPGDYPIRTLALHLSVEAVRLGAGMRLDEIDNALRDVTGLARVADELLVAAANQQRAHRLLLVVDQFEEVLTRTNPADRGHFARLLTHAATASATVVITLRPEFLEPLLSDPSLADLRISPMPLRPLGVDALTTVVVEPARVAGIGLDQKLVRRIVADTGTGEALPLLAFALEQLGEGLGRGSWLSAQRYENIGGVTGALTTQANAALQAACERSGRTESAVITDLLRLVTVDESGLPTSRRVPYAGLADNVRAELDAFVERRLLATDTVDGVAGVTATHEAFLTRWPPLAQATAKATVALRTRRDVENAAADWVASGQDRQRLWDGGHLAATVENLGARMGRPDGNQRWHRPGKKILLVERIDIDETGRQFLHAGIRRDRRKRRLLVATLSGLLAIAVIAAVLATVNQRKAQAQERIAIARQLLAQAEALAGRDPQTALRLSLAAHRLNRDPETLAGVRNTLAATRYTGTLTGHTGPVHAVAFATDKRLLATGGDDRSVQLWDVSELAPARRLGAPLKGLDGPVRALAFASQGHTLAVSGDDRAVQLWDVTDPEHPQDRLPMLADHADWVNALAFSPDGTTLATGMLNGTIQLWNLSDPTRPHAYGPPLSGLDGSIRALEFTADGRTLAASGDTRTVLMWDLTNRANPRPRQPALTAHADWIHALAFSPDGTTLATGMLNGTIQLWNLSDPTRPQAHDPPLTDHTDPIRALAYSPDGRTLASSSDDRTVLLWDTTGAVQRASPRLTGHTRPVRALAFAPDGRTLATGSEDGTSMLWDTSDRTAPTWQRTPITGHQDWVWRVVFAPDGRTLATGSADQTVLLWDVTDPANPRQVSPPLTGVTAKLPSGESAHAIQPIAFSPDGHRIAIGTDLGIALWDVINPATPQQIQTPLTGSYSAVASIAFTSDARLLAAGTTDGSVLLWDMADPAHPKRIEPPLRSSFVAIVSMAFQPGGRTLAAAESLNGTVKLWDVSDPARPKEKSPPLSGHGGGVWSLAFAPDGQTLATGDEDGMVRLWDMSDPARKGGRLLPGHLAVAMSVAFSPDGRTLATGSLDRSVILWDVTDRTHPQRLGRPLTGHAVLSLVFAPDGKTIATGGTDRRAVLRSIDSLTALRTRAIELACSYASGGLDQSQWASFLPNQSYQDSCSTL